MKKQLVCTLKTKDRESGELVEIFWDGENLIDADGKEIMGGQQVSTKKEAIEKAFALWNWWETFECIMEYDEYQEAADQYGITTYNDKEYALTEQAKFAGLENLRINNSIYVLDSNNYSASCIDQEGNEHTAYFVVKNKEAELEDSCDWEHASYVKEA